MCVGAISLITIPSRFIEQLRELKWHRLVGLSMKWKSEASFNSLDILKHFLIADIVRDSMSGGAQQ